jgi:4'-phosphopantetheinyl transferase
MTTLVPLPWPAGEVPELPPGAVQVWSLAFRDSEATHQELRQILALYSGADPRELTIEPAACLHCGEPHGKPFVSDPRAGWLRFNISHSADLAVVAVANGREVGVDVEAVREGRRVQGIADRWFGPGEAAALRKLEGTERDELFYRLWVRKEAYLKATGQGIFLERLAGSDPPPGWELIDLDVGERYAGAVVTGPAGAARRSR